MLATKENMTEAEVARQERGRLLAQRLRIVRKAPGLYVVPASSGPGSYFVETDANGMPVEDDAAIREVQEERAGR